MTTDRIIVFTPAGDQYELPVGATAIDLAYAIHIGLGNQCMGVRVNGRQTTLATPLQHHDHVEILTGSTNFGPSPDWLNRVKTARARSAIRRWLKLQDPEATRAKGEALLTRKLEQTNSVMIWDEVLKRLDVVARQWGYKEAPDLLIALGLRKHNLDVLIRKLEKTEPNPELIGPPRAKLLSLEEAHRPQRLAGCCNPLPPDEIVAYITKNGMISIHQMGCKRVQERRTVLEAEWNQVAMRQQVQIELVGVDRLGLVHDVSDIIQEMQISMTGFHADRMLDNSARIQIGIEALPSHQLEQLLERLGQVPTIRDVRPSFSATPAYFAGSVMEQHKANPYTLRPASGRGFFGRRRELKELVDHLRGVNPGEAVLLWGARRVGKTSLLLRFQQRVMRGGEMVTAFVDMQRLSGRSTTIFLHDILKSLVQALPDGRERAPRLSRMKRDPLSYFKSFIENDPALRRKHLVLIIDEFQLLPFLQQREVSFADINRYFRSLIQHHGGVSLVFSGGGVLDHLLAGTDVAFMLEVAKHQKIGVLDSSSARELILQPAVRVRYDETAVNHLLQLTANHPYYLQWLCGELMQQEEAHILPSHIDQLLQSWLPQQGEQFFSHLWGYSSGSNSQEQQQNKLILTAVSTLTPDWIDLPTLMQSQIATVLDEHTVWKGLQNLEKMDTLIKEGESYRLQVPLCAQWFRAHYTIPYVIKENQWS